MLTEDGQLVIPSGAYWAEEGPAELGGLLRVHPGVWADTDCRAFLQVLGCQVLTAEQVAEHRYLQQVEQLRDLWPSLSDHERIEWTGRLFRFHRAGLLRHEHVNFLEVRTENGTWCPPDHVFFPDAYATGRHLQWLVEKELLPAEPGQLPFLSVEYLGLGGEPAQWRDFFVELGVDRQLDDKRRAGMVQSVAEQVLIRFECARGRNPVKVPAQAERGYDFESGNRRIELKSRHDREPPIGLSRAQYQAVRDDAHYVYVVVAALSTPELFVLHGPTLLNLLPEVLFPYKEWQRLAVDRYRV